MHDFRRNSQYPCLQVLRTLILGTDFEKLDSHGSALLVLTRSSMGIVVRDQNRLSWMEATTELIGTRSREAANSA